MVVVIGGHFYEEIIELTKKSLLENVFLLRGIVKYLASQGLYPTAVLTYCVGVRDLVSLDVSLEDRKSKA